MTTVTVSIHKSRSGKSYATTLTVGHTARPTFRGRVPRLARLMALAIRCDGLLATGEVETRAGLARRGRVTRARMTQILNLLNLAPDLQEAILFLPRIVAGRDRWTLRQLLPIAAHLDWRVQRKLWRELCSRLKTDDDSTVPNRAE